LSSLDRLNRARHRGAGESRASLGSFTVLRSKSSKAIILAAMLIAIFGAELGPRVRVWAGERYTSGRPAQFFSWNIADRAAGYGHVVGIAHNAGDAPGTAALALANGAGYIEIDVVYLNGALYAAHGRPQGTLRDLAWRLAPPVYLLDAWNYSAAAKGIELDIKDGSPMALQMLVNFLNDHWDGDQPLMVASKSPAALSYLADRIPGAFRVLSIDTPAALDAFHSGDASGARLDGVTVRDTLLTKESVEAFKQDGLLVLAWTVDDPARLDQLLDLGIDGVASNNLAITKRLSGGAFTWTR
jgi:hypothetical protein